MWITKLLHLPEGRKAAAEHFQEGSLDPAAHVNDDSKSARIGAASTADLETALKLLQDDEQEVRLAARSRIAELRWSTPAKVPKERIRDHH
jgi:hypothetical protein